MWIGFVVFVCFLASHVASHTFTILFRHRKTRDELSHNVFLMLQECNKFREHQAHETLIDMLEQQLSHRKQLVRDLQSQIESVQQHVGVVQAMDLE